MADRIENTNPVDTDVVITNTDDTNPPHLDDEGFDAVNDVTINDTIERVNIANEDRNVLAINLTHKYPAMVQSEEGVYVLGESETVFLSMTKLLKANDDLLLLNALYKANDEMLNMNVLAVLLKNANISIIARHHDAGDVYEDYAGNQHAYENEGFAYEVRKVVLSKAMNKRIDKLIDAKV